MGLTAEQIAFIDRELRRTEEEPRRRNADDRSAVVERRETVSLERLLPRDWQQQAKTLTFSATENRAIDEIISALRSYREPDEPLDAKRIAERFERVAGGGEGDENLRRHVMLPLLQLIKLERDLRQRAERALSVDNNRNEYDVDKLATNTARLVEADIARVNRKNEFLTAHTLQQLKLTAHAAVEAAKKQLELLDQLFGSRDEELEYRPELDENGAIIMSVCSRIRPRRRNVGASRSADIDDDEDDVGADVANERTDDNRQSSLAVAIFGILWQAFQFVFWTTLQDGLPLLTEIAIIFYQSGNNSSLLATQYANISFEGYETSNPPPLEVYLFGDYGTGLYRMRGDIVPHPSVSLNLYNTIAAYIQHYLVEGAALTLGREHNFLGVLVVAIVVRTIVNKTMQAAIGLGARGRSFMQQRMITRLRRYGNPKRSTAGY